MLRCLLVLLLLPGTYLTALAQATIYQSFEVDSAASPRGGPGMLETFLSANLRKPIMAQAANATGRVTLKAVVEPDGRVTDVQILRGLRPDCDREAVRVLSLFNAWKPAQKQGTAVRQAVTYPVVFKSNAPVFVQEGSLVNYYDSAFKGVTEPTTASYMTTTKIDTTTGLPTDELLVYAVVRGRKGAKVNQFPLRRDEIKLADPAREPLYKVGHKRPTSDWIGLIYTLSADGTILALSPANLLSGKIVTYSKKGLVESIEDYELGSRMEWFPNGQFRKLMTRKTGDKTTTTRGFDSHLLVSEWDTDGNCMVMRGNGKVTYRSDVASKLDPNQRTMLTEEGAYQDGLPHGLWKAQTADGSYSYEERYEAGKCLGGTAIVNGERMRYNEAEQSPEFKGGVSAMYAFLSNNMRYPQDAQRSSVSGKVFVLFTVCTDGSLCDFDILKGVYPSMDEEALRVVKRMNNLWKLGIQRGQPVRVRYNLPISFRLE